MRGSAWVLGLALSVLAGCDQGPAPEPTPPPAQTEAAPPVAATDEAPAVLAPNTAQNDAVTCLAYVSLQRAAVLEGRAQGDADILEAASRTLRAEAEGQFRPDELAQYYASSIAVLDDTPPAELHAHAESCVGRVSH